MQADINTDTKLNKRQLDSLEKHLLNDFQHGFPLVSRPFKKIAEQLGTSEDVIVDRLNELTVVIKCRLILLDGLVVLLQIFKYCSL